MATVVFLTNASTSPWTVPGDFDNSNNTVEGLGPGGNGGIGDGTNGGAGGGGGAYAKSVNVDLSGGNPSFTVGLGGSQTATQFKDSSTLVADYGRNASGTTPGAGGLDTNCTAIGTGALKYSGGSGVWTSALYGLPGGGCAGPNGAGGDGNSSGKQGGTADGGTVAGAPKYGSANSGAEWDSTHGCGSGASQQNGNSANGANGGQYAGGASGSGKTGTAGGTGGDGLIVITYPVGANYSVSISESGTASDSPSGTYQTSAANSESLSASDALAGGETIPATLAEAASAADSVAGGYAVALAESASAADSISATESASVAVAEALSAADTPSSLASFAAALAETVTAADAVSDIDHAVAAIAEALAATDAPATAAHFAATLAESVSAADAVNGGHVYAVSVSESVSAADSADAYIPRYAVATGLTNSTAVWSQSSGGAPGASAPDLSHKAIFNAASGAITVTAASGGFTCKGADFTGFTGTLAGTGAISTYGDVILSSGMTLSWSSSLNFQAAAHLKSAGHTLGAININLATGTDILTLDDDLSCTWLSPVTGVLDANGHAVAAFGMLSSYATARGLKMGSGTWTLTQTGTIWDVGAAGFTLDPGTSKIVIPATGAASKTFKGGGLAYHDFNNFASSGAGGLSLTGSNSFNDFGAANGTTTIFAHGTTQTATAFAFPGASGSPIVLASDSAGNAFTLSQASGTVSADYLTLSDSIATGGAAFNAAHSTDNGGNTGWNFTSGTYNVSVAEALSAADSDAASAVFAAGLAEAASASDSDSTLRLLLGAISESASGADAANAARLAAASIAEALSASDSETGITGLGGAIAEVLSAADAVAEEGAFGATIVEVLHAADTAAAAHRLTASIAETLAAADHVTNAQSAATAESLTPSDAATVQTDFAAALADALAAAAVLAATLTRPGALAETLAAADAPLAHRIQPASMSETLAATDAPHVAASVYHAAIGEWIFANDIVQEPGTVIPPRSFAFFIG